MESLVAVVFDPFFVVSIALLGYAVWSRRKALRRGDGARVERQEWRWLVNQAIASMWLLVILTAAFTDFVDPPTYQWVPSMILSVFVTLGTMIVLRGAPSSGDRPAEAPRIDWLRWAATLAAVVFAAVILLAWLVLDLSLEKGLASGVVAAFSVAATSVWLVGSVAVMRSR